MKKAWAIARVTVLQGLRMRLIVVLILFLLVTVAALPLVLKAGSLLDRLRVVVTYCMYATIFLMSLLTVFLSCGVLASEIKQKQIYILDTKAISRWQILLGKWLGVLILNAGILVIMGGVSYGILRYLGRRHEVRSARAQYEQATAEAQILVARAAAKPPVPDLAAEVDEEYQRLKTQGLTVSGRTEGWHRRQLRKIVMHRGVAIGPRQDYVWEFHNLPRDVARGGAISLRFKHYCSARKEGIRQEEIPGVWAIGPSRESVVDLGTRAQGLGSGVREVVESRAGDELFLMTMKAPSAAINDVLIPGYVAAPDGSLYIYYRNELYNEKDPIARFPYDDGIEVLYPAGTLEANFVRGLGLIFIWLAFLAILGLMGASFLGFPVATFLALTVMVIAMAMPLWRYLAESLFLFKPDWAPQGVYAESKDMIVQGVAKAFLFIFPNFSQYDPVPMLVEGRLVPYTSFLWGLLDLVAIRGGVLALLAVFFFQRREIAGVVD